MARAGMKQRYPVECVVEALHQAKARVREAARILGCTPMTVYNYIRRYEDVAAVALHVPEESCLPDDVREDKISSLSKRAEQRLPLFQA